MTTMIDSRHVNVLRSMATPALLGKMANDAQRGVVYSRRSVARSFAWIRPNDLIFNFLVNDWLLGEATRKRHTRLECRYGELGQRVRPRMLKVYAGNLAATPRQLSVLNTPIDLTEVDCDAFILAGSTDHITPWQTCFMTSQVTAGRSEFVLALTGHFSHWSIHRGRRAASSGACAPGPDAGRMACQEHRAPGLMVASMDEMAHRALRSDHTGPQQARALRYPAIEPAPGRYLRET